MKILLILAMFQLSGCGLAFKAMAASYNNADQCQAFNKPSGYQRPSFCGSGAINSSGTYYVRDFQSGQVTGTIQRGVY